MMSAQLRSASTPVASTTLPFTAITWRAVAAVPLLLVAQSIIWAPAAGLVLKGLVLSTGLLAYTAPAAALLTVATLTPIGAVMTTHVFEAHPTRISEGMVLAFLAGLTVRSLVSRRRETLAWTGFRMWGVAYSAVAVGSCLALMATQQLWQDDVAPFILSVLRFLVVGYHDVIGDLRPWERPVGFEYVAVTIMLVSGVALAGSAVQLCRADPRLPRRLAGGLVAGGAAAALLSFLPDVSGQDFSLASLFAPQRWSAFTGKVGTASSYFLLVGAIAIGGAGERRRGLWLLAAGLIGIALWLTGTRAALLACLLVALGVGLVRLWSHGVRPSRAVLAAAAMMSVVVIVLVAARWDVLGAQMASSLRFRWLLSESALQMVAEDPLFGVGIGQFYLTSERFSTQELVLLARTGANQAGLTNAHNYFLQVGAELGLVGLTTFLLLIGAVLLPLAMALRRTAQDRLLIGTLAGVTGFLITCVAGQPLIVSIVAYPFWLALGLLVALGETTTRGDVAQQAVPATGYSGTNTARIIAVATLLLVVGGLAGHRSWTSRRGIDMTRVNYGLYDWETDPAGTRFRWTSDSATVFLDGSSVTASVPIRAGSPVSVPGKVNIYLNGRLAVEIPLTDNDWHTTQIQLAPSRRPHRIDADVEPVWHPAEVLPDSTDDRELGVMLGEIMTERSPASS